MLFANVQQFSLIIGEKCMNIVSYKNTVDKKILAADIIFID